MPTKRVSKKQTRASTHPVKKVSAESKKIIEKIRRLVADLPEMTEVLAWGEPTWRVKGKLFAQFDNHHHGSEHIAVWIPGAPGQQEALIESDPERFFRPPYVGHKGWVAIILDGKPDWGMVAALLEGAHGLIAAKKR